MESQEPQPPVLIPPPQSCAAFQHPSTWNLVVSLVLAVGIVVSYLPQHIRVIKRRSSEGISPWFLLLGVMSGICAVCNIWILGGPVYHCCTIVSFGDCFASTLGIAQITLQAVSATMILVLALIFTKDQPFEAPEEYTKLVVVGKASLLTFITSFIISIYVYFYRPALKNATADIFGILGAALAVVQYFPQIYTTYTLKHAGTLSIPMMCMQTPGGFLWAASLAAREGTTWSSWLPYFTAASLQMIVLVLAVYFEIKIKQRAQKQGPTTGTPSERTGLLE